MFIRQQLKMLFTGDVSLLVLSGLASQVINLVSYPLLAQSYSPAAFGAFSVVIALANFFGAAILLRFDTIIQIVDPGEDDDILSAALVAGFGFALAGMALLLVFGEFLFGLFAENQDWHLGYAVVVPLLALMNGIFALSRQYFAKLRRYHRFSLTIFLRTLVMVSSQLGLVVLLPGPGGLIAGFCLGLGLALVLAWPVPAATLSHVAAAPAKALLAARAAVHRHADYIRVDVVNTLISASVLSIYPIIVLLSFGAEEAGIFAVASRFVFIPVNVLAGSVSTVYFQRLSLAVRQGEGMRRLFGSTLSLAAVAAAVISVVVVFAADPFVRMLFPPEWLQTSHVMLLLLPTFAVRFIIGSIGSTPLALARPKFLLAWNLTQIAIIGITWIATINQSLDLFLLASGSGLAAAGAVYLAILSGLVKQTVN